MISGMENKTVKSRLSELKLRPLKSRGQNFIIDPAVPAAIVEFGRADQARQIVEIGPGLGALTELLSRYGELTVVEIEPKFCRDLERRFPGIRVIEGDIRGVSFSALGRDLVVFGNLPYAFSTEIIFHLIENASCIKRAVLLLQRQFAERLAAKPGGRDYGVLSISCQLWADIVLGPLISGRAFHPPAKVESRLVELVFSGAPRYEIGDLSWFNMAVRAAFFRRRKKLINSLEAAGLFPRKKIEEALEHAAIDGARRPETLSIEEYVRLASLLV